MGEKAIDPIAENQTELMILTLNNRQDGDKMINQAVAAILLSMTKVSAEFTGMKTEIQTMKAELWKPKDLDEHIEKIHAESCRMCPTRRFVEIMEMQQKHDEKEAGKTASVRQQGEYGGGRNQAATGWSAVLAFLLSERGLLAIVVLLFALMCARSYLGQQGYQDVTQTMRSAGASADRAM